MTDETIRTSVTLAWIFVIATYAAACIWVGVRLINRRPWAKRAILALVLVPLLYVVSSGPTKRLTFRRDVWTEPAVLPDGTIGRTAHCRTDRGKWFPIAFAPLLVASDQPWGKPVAWYWNLFPIDESL